MTGQEDDRPAAPGSMSGTPPPAPAPSGASTEVVATTSSTRPATHNRSVAHPPGTTNTTAANTRCPPPTAADLAATTRVCHSCRGTKPQALFPRPNWSCISCYTRRDRLTALQDGVDFDFDAWTATKEAQFEDWRWAEEQVPVVMLAWERQRATFEAARRRERGAAPAPERRREQDASALVVLPREAARRREEEAAAAAAAAATAAVARAEVRGDDGVRTIIVEVDSEELDGVIINIDIGWR